MRKSIYHMNLIMLTVLIAAVFWVCMSGMALAKRTEKIKPQPQNAYPLSVFRCYKGSNIGKAGAT